MSRVIYQFIDFSPPISCESAPNRRGEYYPPANPCLCYCKESNNVLDKSFQYVYNELRCLGLPQREIL